MRVLSGVRDNPARLGLLGLGAIVLAVAMALNLGPLLGVLTGSSYVAEFRHGSGLRAGDPVQVSGLAVGRVEQVEIVGDHVEVEFTVQDVRVGTRSRAAIKTASAVGNRFLDLDPEGAGDAERIPLARTTVPYSLTAALGDVTAASEGVDTGQLARALDSVSEQLQGTPDSFEAAIEGVDRLSSAVAARDEALSRLLREAADVSDVLRTRSDQVVSLMAAGNEILAELQGRREVIRTLLVGTRQISRQLTGLVRENRATLAPALDEVRGVVKVLMRNIDSIDFAIDHIGGYTRNLGEAVGGGPFFYGFVQNIVPTNLFPVPLEPETQGDSR